MSQISLKNSFGKVVFQIFVEIEMTWNENRSFGRHFETVNFFWVRRESGFLKGSNGAPFGHQQVGDTLVF